MKRATLLIAALFITCVSVVQAQEPWVRFYDTTTELSGYKDLKGNIKIPARFAGLTRADSFYHIIAVHEKANSSYNPFYLLKDGRKIGADSVYVFDFTFDCEQEGKIMFVDRKKDRVGFLSEKGEAVIPAEYNYATPFHNGMAVAHRNAKRKCWDDHGDSMHCEHWGWEGGEDLLINEKNEILADSLNIDPESINWYSKKVNDSLVDTSVSMQLKGRNNITYSFVNYDKEFSKWFYATFLPALQTKKSTLSNLLFPEITYWSDKKGWTSLRKSSFLKTFPALLIPKRFEPDKLKEILLAQDEFNELIFDKGIYKKYLTACGAHNKAQFPLYHVMLTYYKKRPKPLNGIDSDFLREYDIDYQEHFEFLRTENGYQLLSVSFKK